MIALRKLRTPDGLLVKELSQELWSELKMGSPGSQMDALLEALPEALKLRKLGYGFSIKYETDNSLTFVTVDPGQLTRQGARGRCLGLR